MPCHAPASARWQCHLHPLRVMRMKFIPTAAWACTTTPTFAVTPTPRCSNGLLWNSHPPLHAHTHTHAVFTPHSETPPTPACKPTPHPCCIHAALGVPTHACMQTHTHTHAARFMDAHVCPRWFWHATEYSDVRCCSTVCSAQAAACVRLCWAHMQTHWQASLCTITVCKGNSSII